MNKHNPMTVAGRLAAAGTAFSKKTRRRRAYALVDRSRRMRAWVGVLLTCKIAVMAAIFAYK